MRAFILCAGRGERLWPLSSLLPKCLWPIGGKPCARVIADKLHDAGVQPNICCLEKDLPLFSHEFRDIEPNIFATKEPAGTAGQLAAVKNELGELPQGNFVVWYGDCLVDVDVKRFVDEADWRITSTPKMLGVLLCTNRVQSEFGMVVTEGTDGSSLITSFVEKPGISNLTWTGVAVLSPGMADYLDVGLDFGRDVFPLVIKEGGRLFCYVTGGSYYDIGSIPAYNRANEMASSGSLFSP